MDVVTIGETMVLFTPETNGLMRHAQSFTLKFGGAESNLAIGLARLGHQVGWISRVGDDEFGIAMASFIRGQGVDVSQVKHTATAPTGVYFKEVIHPSNVRVQYYRKGSAASGLAPEDLDAEYIGQAKFLHITGITPALSQSCYSTVKQAIETAKQQGVKVIFDPNLRKALWDEAVAQRVLLELAAQADIVLPGVSEGEFLFGKKDPASLAESFLQNGASLVVMKLGPEGAYYRTATDSGYVSGFTVKQVVDPVGAGDGFASGFLSGMLDGLSTTQAIERGCAVGAMVTMVAGDVEGLPDKRMLESFMHSSDGDDVTR